MQEVPVLLKVNPAGERDENAERVLAESFRGS